MEDRMLTYHVALVAEESAIDLKELTAVAAALQKQVSRDFAPLWGIDADVSAFATLEDMPLDYWPVIVKDNIDNPTAAGYHQDDHGQPFSLVKYEQDWTLTASHETLEMLGDPFGRHMVAGQSPVASQGRVKFLVEVADPCEAAEFSYQVNGVVVSDFYTPHYFDPVASPSVRYSFQGSITQPRQVLQGGYLSWYDPASRQWWQRTWFGAKAVDGAVTDLKITNGNLRAAIDRKTQERRAKAMRLPKPKRAPARDAFVNRAADLRKAMRQVSR
jgi:hypothetical protein